MAKYAAESERLWLQPLSIAEHLEDCHLVMSNEKAMFWSLRPLPTSLEGTRQMMVNHIPSTEKPWIENYAILLKGSVSEFTGKPRVIGTVGASRNEPAGAEIGYGLHPEYWSMGYMSEALKLFVGVYWGPGRDASRETIIAEIDPENVASGRVVEKLGFKRGEVLKKCYQRASDVRAGNLEMRDQVRWYLHRPVEGMWEGYDVAQATKGPE